MASMHKNMNVRGSIVALLLLLMCLEGGRVAVSIASESREERVLVSTCPQNKAAASHNAQKKEQVATSRQQMERINNRILVADGAVERSGHVAVAGQVSLTQQQNRE